MFASQYAAAKVGKSTMRILMTYARLPRVSAVLAGVIWLAACSTPASQPTTANTFPAQTTSPASATSAAPPASASPSPSTTGAENLVLTNAIRAQLVAAAARLNGLPASAYVGLVHGESYYGFDPDTNAYWAGGALEPSPSSQQAQVSVQDDGGYYLFEEPAGGSWTAYAVGLAGVDGATCSVHLPPAIVASWRWTAGACHPAGT
jgi:hypothetical protein